MAPILDHDNSPSRRRRDFTWGGRGAALGGFVALACGACAAALPLATILGLAGGAALIAGGLGFALAGGSVFSLGAVAAHRRAGKRAVAGHDCCAPRPVEAAPQRSAPNMPPQTSSPSLRQTA